jgi:TP901 family phage tail tape measure protein
MALPPVFIEFVGSYTGLAATVKGVKRELAGVEGEGGQYMSKLGAVSKAALLGMGVAAVAVGYKTVRMAADFQSAMLQISTQAGVPKSQLKSLGDGVLNLAGQVGFSPTSLAQALYHIESSFASVGIKGPTALNLLKVAAQGAAVGHADLVDVTNALNGAVVSGIPGVQDFGQAMGVLNSIVGSGDMSMQDLADAMGTGMVSAVKTYGLSLKDVGAALAVFGDNQMRGENAATALRMSVQAMAKPVAGGATELKKLGMSATQMATDMQKGGLLPALNDLEAHLKAAGITGVQTGGVLTTIFGKKAGTGMNILLDQLDRVRGKYPELAKGANGFGAAVAANQATFSQKMKDAQAAIQALGVKIGTALLPSATKALGAISGMVGFMTSHASVLKVFGIGLGAVAIGLTAASIASWSFTDSLLADPLTWIVVGIVAAVAAIALLITHFGQISSWIKGHMPGLASFFTGLWQGAMKIFSAVWDWAAKEVQRVVKWFDQNVLVWVKARAADFTKWWAQNGAMVTQVWGQLWASVKAIASIVWDWIGVAATNLASVFTIAWDLIVGAVKLAWAIISGIVTFAIHLVMNTITVALDILTGHWGKVWGDLVHLVGQAFADIWHLLVGVAKSLWGTLTQVGTDIINGIVTGLTAAGSAIYDTLKQLAGDALKSVKSFLGINSPSRVFRDEVGRWIPHGIAAGITEHADAAHAAVRNVARGMVTTAQTELEINSPSRVFQRIGHWVHMGLIAGLTGTQKQVVSAVNKTITLLQDAHTRAASQLEGYVGREGRLLETLANKRDAVAARLKAAQKQLVTLQADWTKERDSVASGIMQNASIVMSNTNGPIGAGDVITNMINQVQASQQFARNLDRLKAEGLRADLINQIAQAGVSGGGDTASALAYASQAQIRQINTMQTQLTTSASSTGAVVANAMYGAGIQSAQGLVKGLESQEGSIVKMMTRIAQSMANAIKRALRIHSPSRVFHEIGQFITEGLSNGVTESSHKPVSAVTALAGAITRAGKPAPLSMGNAGFGGTVVYETNVNVTVQGTVRSDRDLRDVIQTEMLRLGGRNSTTWAPYRR